MVTSKTYKDLIFIERLFFIKKEEFMQVNLKFFKFKDTDMNPIKNINEWPFFNDNHSFYISIEPPRGKFMNGLHIVSIISPPKHPLLLKVLNTLLEIIEENNEYSGPSWREIIYTTGPYAWARAFTEFFGYKYVKKYPPNNFEDDYYIKDVLLFLYDDIKRPNSRS